MKDAEKLLFSILREDLGVESGDVIYLGVEMGKLPLPTITAALSRDSIRERERKWSQFLLDVLLEVLAPDGTLLVPTFSYDYARKGLAYHHETTPSEIGPFTEFFRTTKGVCRCLHPLHSVAGIGPKTPEILFDVGLAAFGPRSAFGRLRNASCKFLSLGVPLGLSLTYAHHLEQVYGVNHMYNKLFNTSVFVGGVEQPGPWLCSVRYLGIGIEAKISNLENGLRNEGFLLESSRWRYPMQVVHVDHVEEVGFRMLEKDPCAWLKESVEVHIEAPGAFRQVNVRRAVHLKIE